MNDISNFIGSVFNDDCRTFMQQMPDESVDLIISDPPYGIAKKKPLKGTSHGNIQTLAENWDIFGSKQKFLDFSKAWMTEAKRILKPRGSIFVWGTRESIFDMKYLLDECGYYFLDNIAWTKRDAPPNVTCRGYAHSTEFVLWYCNSDSKWTFNHNELKKHNNGKQMRNFWDVARSMSKNENTPHKTQKKLQVAEIIVEGHSNVGDIVYIPFAGSGTEIEACIRHGRNWVATEKHKPYIDEIILPRIAKAEIALK